MHEEDIDNILEVKIKFWGCFGHWVIY